MAARSKAAPEALNYIDRGPQLLAEDGVAMHAPVEENQVTPSEHALQGARRQELTAVAPVPKAGAGGGSDRRPFQMGHHFRVPRATVVAAPSKAG